ncbi:hypothetical protein [Georgenia deserti]|uniref:DUF3322 domain-containing protein n=1 Tax=Georgenia deserti TaxID=2093781 RepID=A0ABW4KYF7_9MICO
MKRSGRSKERRDEYAARRVVESALGVAVTRFEDGTQNGQIDAIVQWPDRPAAALEIVADHDTAFMKQWAAASKREHKVKIPSLRKTWAAHLGRKAQLKDVERHLKQFVPVVENDPEAMSAPDVAEMHDRLHILSLSPSASSDKGGEIRLYIEGWSGIAADTSMADYVERILAEHPDVPAKLKRHPAAEKHAFIWATIGSDYGITFALERRPDAPLPKKSPELPDGVTHVWVVGSATSQGAVSWWPDRGWWRPQWSWSAIENEASS